VERSCNERVLRALSTGEMSTTASYAYRAARSDGVLEVGVLSAESREAAARSLEARGLFPVELNAEREERARKGKRISSRDLALGFRVLATLLEASLPINRALASMGELAPPSWERALPEISRSVKEGSSLTAALAESAMEIPPVVLGIVKAGEAGSGLAVAVRRAAELLEHHAAMRSAIRSALAYPALLATAATASVALLVGVVLPRFGTILSDLGQSLPPTTRIVLAASTVIRAWSPAGLIVLALLLVVWRSWTSSEEGRARWHELLLALPVVGGVRRSAATARTAAALSALLESGVPISAALVHAARASGDACLTERILRAREAIVEGRRPSDALQAEDALTVTAIRLTRAGEETGRLSEMLSHAAALERERSESMVKSAVRLLEPSLILVFGGLVALVAAALLQAIYSVRPT
jgi:general secretion pathway protein F